MDTDSFYDSYGDPTEVDVYNAGSHTSPLRKTLFSYNGPFVGLLTSETVEDGSGNVAQWTNYIYDAHGNLTEVSQGITGSQTLNTFYTYNSNGTMATSKDMAGNVTTYSYSSGVCNGAFPVEIIYPNGYNEQPSWNCDGGVMTGMTDINDHVDSIAYNGVFDGRPTSVTDAMGRSTAFNYADNPSSPWTAETTMTFNGGQSVTGNLVTFDFLGRPQLAQNQQYPNTNNYDSTETYYNPEGLPGKASVAYAAGAAGDYTGSSFQSMTYDALGRPLVFTNADGSQAQLQYNDNDVLRTIGAQNRQLEYNALGELVSVCEVANLAGAGSCGQSYNAGQGYLTKYQYDGAGNLLEVDQNDQSGSPQKRFFTYDDMGRLTSESNPENGLTDYYYDSLPSGSTCAGYSSPGNLVETKDADGNVTCYQYDSMNRVVSIVYANSGTPAKTFVYDSATVDGQAMTNAVGLLAEVYTGQASGKITDEGFSYDADGEMTAFYELTPDSGGYYVVNAGYHANGMLATLTGTGWSGGFGFGLEGEGRPCSVVAGNPPSSNPNCQPSGTVLAQNASYTLDLAQGVTFGSGDSDSFAYDANTGAMTSYTFNVNGQTDSGQLGWNSDGTLGSLDITDNISGSQDSQNCGYGYDDLLRLTSVNCGSSQQESYSYDPFGNLIVNSGGNSLGGPGSYNTQNLITNWDSIAYNNDGDVASDSNDSFTWDAANQMTGAADSNQSYTLIRDGLGRVVELQSSAGDTEIEYSVTGAKLGLMNGQNLSWGFVPLPDDAEAVYNGSSLAYYRHSDWLGSARLASTPGRGVAFDTAYAAFGEPYAGSGPNNSMSAMRFAGHNSNILNSGSEPVYDAWYRGYSYLERRWLQPDPSGLAAVNPTNPQSWNRYSYVINNPLSYTDLFGLDKAVPSPRCASGWVDITSDQCWNPYDPQSPYVVFYLPTIPNIPGIHGPIVIGHSKKHQNCIVPNTIQNGIIHGLSFISKFSNKTIGIGVGGSAGAGIGIGGTVSVSGQIVASPNGSSAIELNMGINTFPTGIQFGAGALGGIQLSISGASNPQQLSGFGADASASVADGLGFGGDLSIGSTWQFSTTIGLGAGGKGGAGTFNFTSITPFCKD